MNDANRSFKIRIEAELPVKGSRTSPLRFLSTMSWGAQLPSCRDEYRLTKENVMQWQMCKWINTSVSNEKRENKRQAIANTKNLFRGSSHCSTFPLSPLWRISLSTKGSFTKELYNKKFKVLHKTGVHNSITQSSTQEVAQS